MAFNTVREIDNLVPIRHVLVSLFDKTGLAPFVQGLLETCPGIRLYSTGGTYKALEEALGEKAKDHLVAVSEYTGQPEMQGGLVKTLDFKIYLGILSETYNEAHQADLRRTQAVSIDMVIGNLYPFQRVTANADVTPEEARGNIDIGGPCMIRASAKNFIRTASVTDTADYPALLEELRATDGKLSLRTRFHLMQKAFAHTAAYDAAIARFFGDLSSEKVSATYPTQH